MQSAVYGVWRKIIISCPKCRQCCWFVLLSMRQTSENVLLCYNIYKLFVTGICQFYVFVI